MMLRGFYAMENTRTPFLIQVAVAGTNVVAAFILTSMVSPRHVPVALALAFGASYLVGATLSAARLPGTPVFGPEMRLFLVRLAIACCGAALVMVSVLTALHASGVPADTPARALGLLALSGPAGAGTYLLLARVVGLTELNSVVGALRRRS
jgi:putative peptidoglycan lipid II flippase